MKKIIICAVLLLAAVFVWGQHEKDLEGIWVNYEDEYFFAFIGNMCFLGGIYDGYYELEDDAATFTYNKNTKTLELIYYDDDKERLGVSLNGNKLTLNYYGENLILTKRTDSPAQSAITGVWRGPRPWVFAFLNDQVFIIDEDGDSDCGPYKFSGNRGSFMTNDYEWEIEFTVNGNTMAVSGDVRGSFTRDK